LTPNLPFCGNGIIDKDEDCDSGGMGLSGLDSCCSASCKLIGNATCSPVNYECCKDCQMAPANTLCRGSSRELCQEAAVCTGLSLYCPSSSPLADNTPCIDEGKCFGGHCLDYCAYAGRLTNKILRPCRCEDFASSCLRCCRSLTEPCKPLNSSSSESNLQDGRPCLYGYCEAGKCQKASANMIQRLFSFIEHLDASTFVAFMKSNIVGTVMVFSLVVWLPLSCTISYLDKRNERKAKQQEQLLLAKEAAPGQPLKTEVLAKPLKDYTVKTSRFRYTTRPNYLAYEEPGAASLYPLQEETLEAESAAPHSNPPTAQIKYRSQREPDKLLETMV
ncbi:unnamed protein product, partial [Candidula unifasciata]